MRRHTLLTSLAMAALAAPAVAQASVIVPGTEAQIGGVSVDVDVNGRAVVAYERTIAGRTGVHASTRTLARYRTRDAGVRLGTGRLELARLADGGGPDLVAWSRGSRVRVSLRRGGPYRTELLPASFPRRRVLAGGVAGRRVVLVLGDASRATVAVRSAGGVWRAVPLPGPATGRSAMNVAVSEGSGRVVAAWTEGPIGPQQSVQVAVWTPASGTWSATQTLVAAGSVGAPVARRIRMNRRGAAVVQIGRSPAYAESFLPAPDPRIHVLDAGATTWRAAPGLPDGVATPAPDGTVLHAWRDSPATDVNRLLVAELPPASLTWGAPTTVYETSGPDVEFVTGADDIAVAENGRAAVSVEINPGPAPDGHLWYTRAPGSTAWVRSTGVGETYLDPLLLPGRTRIVSVWRGDDAGSSLPEGEVIPR